MRPRARHVTALLAVAVSACTGQRPPTAVVPTTQPALTQRQAVDRIAALPEVVAFDKQIDHLSGGKVRVAVEVECDVLTNGAWSLGVYEDHDDHDLIWHWFRVNATSGAITVSNLDGDYEPLAAWRAHPD